MDACHFRIVASRSPVCKILDSPSNSASRLQMLALLVGLAGDKAQELSFCRIMLVPNAINSLFFGFNDLEDSAVCPVHRDISRCGADHLGWRTSNLHLRPWYSSTLWGIIHSFIVVADRRGRIQMPVGISGNSFLRMSRSHWRHDSAKGPSMRSVLPITSAYPLLPKMCTILLNTSVSNVARSLSVAACRRRV